MRKASVSIIASFVTCVALVGCGSSQTPAEAPATESPAEPAAEPAAAPSDAPARPQLTAEECEAKGGAVVGDIGDGAIHRPDYKCESGAEPSGTIKAPEGGPVAVEGSVCCPK